MVSYRSIAKKRYAEYLIDVKRVSLLLKDFKLTIQGEEEHILIKATSTIIQRLLAQGKVTCVDLIKFYTKRTIDVGVPLNLVTELLYEKALKIAESRDKILKPLVPKWKNLSV